MRPQTFKERLALSMVPTLGAAILKGLTATWRIQEAGLSSQSPFARPGHSCIYVVWHENALAAGFYSGQPLHALASRSFDGELITRTLLRLGWLAAARGSSSRGGSTGLTEMRDFLERGEHVLLTVDGPRGPRRLAKDGAIQLARLSGHPVVPVAFACGPEFRLKSWDRMLIPPPFARGVFWFGNELRFDPEKRDATADLRRLQEGLDQAGLDASKFLKDAAR